MVIRVTGVKVKNPAQFVRDFLYGLGWWVPDVAGCAERAVKRAVKADYTAGYTAHAVKRAVKADYTAEYTAHAEEPASNTNNSFNQLS